MSWYLANKDGVIGQFASITGLAELRAASAHEPALMDFFEEGHTKNISLCIQQLGKIAKATKSADVKSTALGLGKMMRNQKLVSITQSFGGEDEVVT